MDYSRREFLMSFVPKIDQVSSAKINCPSIIAVGQIASFPVSSTTKIKLSEDDFIVESLPEGIRLVNTKSGQAFKLSLLNGLVQAHLNEPWPDTAVLSILTGEIYNI